jgi:hypothetical protein
MTVARAHRRTLDDRPLQCPNCSERMTLQSVKREAAKPSTAVFECKPCKVSIAETIQDDPNDRTLQ